jgi:large subunit ribosomal protein L6
MSHIGNKFIIIPNNINIEINNNILTVNGLFGSESISIFNNLSLNILDNKIYITKLDTSTKTKSFQGLFRSLLQNIILGLSEKFIKVLTINGVGYKFEIENNILIIIAGFSHTIKLIIPEYLNVKLESPLSLTISGTNKQKVGLFASKIKQISPPEPYKGKGIFYLNEKIRRKVGKTGK